MHQLRLYAAALKRHGVAPEAIAARDLENEFYWYFHLSGLIEKAYQVFDGINADRFSGELPRPLISFCPRSTGGFYHHRKHHIGISMAMTVEHGEAEFMETLLHEIGHIKYQDHSPQFYALIRSFGATGKKAPVTSLLEKKRKNYVLNNYPVEVSCPSCGIRSRFKTRRGLRYACKRCCDKFSGGKFDVRFKFVMA